MANIYIVEDDTNIQEIEAIALKNSGHNVEQFEDAKHFYKKIEEKLPDLAILDIMLPDENGYEIVKKLRKNPATKKLPVIMVTAKTSEIDMVKGLDIGADDYIKKPFSIIEFITRIKAVLRRTVEQPDDKYMTIGEIFLDNERHMVYVDNKGIELTYKEYELLKLLMRNAGIVLSRPSAPSTALAMFPTPDCNGRKVDGMIPRFMSAARKSATFCPILSVNGSAAAKERASSGQLVSTTPTIFFGSTWM